MNLEHTCLNSLGYEIDICGLVLGVPNIEDIIFFLDAWCNSSSWDSPLLCM